MASKLKLWSLLSSVSLAAVGAVAPAMAQETSDEIVVTATGRAAAIQDVPLAVTAVGEELIENAGIRDIRDLQQVAPSYKFFTGQSNTSGTNAIIRGIGTGGDNPGFEAAVGVFIDGVYRSRAGVALGDLPSVERIEVLRGPQGTLFGRNTSAGALNIITQAPEFETHAWGEITTGDLDLLGTRFGFNAPLSDTFAVRLDGALRTRDGYIEDLRSGDDLNTVNRGSGRIQALWDMSPNASLRVILDGASTDEVCCYAVTLLRGATGAAVNGFLAQTQPGVAVGILPGRAGLGTPESFAPSAVGNPEDRQASVTPGREPFESVDEMGISAQLDWDLGGIDLTSVTSFRDWDSTRDQDIDFSDFDRAYREGLEIGFQTATQEIRLHGEFGRVDWLVGAFFGNEQLDQNDRIRVGTQAAAYLDALASGSDLGALGVPDFNGAAPGSGLQIYNTLPNFDPDGAGPAPPMAPPVLWLQAAYGALAQTQDISTPQGQAIAAALAGGVTGLAPALSVADPVDGDGQQNDRWGVDTNSIGVFSHNEISLTDALTLTLGVRFNHEEKEMDANIISRYPGCDAIRANAQSAAAVLGYTPNPQLPGATQAALGSVAAGVLRFLTLACNPAINTVANGIYHDDRTENEWTGTANLAYHVNEDLMVYGGFSRGYKSGGYNIDRSGFNIVPFSVARPSADDLEFEPEFVNAYELGFKSTLFGGSTFFNVNLFYEEITDFQVNAFSGFNFITFNAPELISKGVEVDVSANLTDYLTVQAGLLYNDAYYSQEVVVNPLVAGDVIPSGSRLAYASEWTATGAVTYRMPLTESFGALFHVDARYNGEAPVQTLGRNPATDNEAYTIVNGRIGIGPTNERWSLEVFGSNLTDEYYNVGAFTVPEQDNVAVYPNMPRTWGVTLRARY